MPIKRRTTGVVDTSKTTVTGKLGKPVKVLKKVQKKKEDRQNLGNIMAAFLYKWGSLEGKMVPGIRLRLCFEHIAEFGSYKKLSLDKFDELAKQFEEEIR